VPWFVLALIILCTAALRVRFLDIPLERDEGEYALSGQLMLHGIPPYREAWNMKFPGTYAAYAAIMMLFGQTTRAIHLGLMFVNAATIVLVFLLARRFYDGRAALAAAAAFATISLGYNVLGPQTHAEHFVILFALAGAILMFRAIEKVGLAGFFFSGLCFGAAVLMKQHGLFFGLFGGCWILGRAFRAGNLARRLIAFGFGAVLPFALTCLIMWQLGVFDKFWFWTVHYAREYTAENSLPEGWENFSGEFPDIFLPNAAIWSLSAAGLILLWLRRERLRAALPLTLFFVFSVLAVCPGLYFRNHYFVMSLPAVALLAGGAVFEGSRRLRPYAALIFFALAVSASIYWQRGYLFRMTLVEVSRAEYGMSPFPEAIPIANYIEAHTAADSRPAILGSEPEICFLAHRRPATGYIYTYALMESQPYAATMQDEMIRQIEAAKPEYVVMVGVTSSWDADEDSLIRIFDWWKDYQARHYDRVGVVDMFSRQRVDYRWDADAAKLPPQAVRNLVVYRRRN
jgi:4-amino-4-deoxy-L-arabinose transferase-like glycosyltransferase